MGRYIDGRDSGWVRLQFAANRTLSLFGYLFFSLLTSFILLHLLPGGPFDIDELGSSVVRDQLIEKYRLNQPILDQFFNYLSKIIKLDFGNSFVYPSESVLSLFTSSMQNTLQIFALGLAMILTLFVLVNYLIFVWPKLLAPVMGLYNILVAIPLMVFILIGFYIFCIFLDWTPVIFDGSAIHLIFPVFLLTFKPSVQLIVFFQRHIHEESRKKYSDLHRSFGFSEHQIQFLWAMKNSLYPCIYLFLSFLLSLISGSLLLEIIFSINGVGSLFLSALLNRDHNLILFLCGFYSIVYAAFFFLQTSFLNYLNPRTLVYEV